MPWPEIIVRLFQARYDYEWAPFVTKAQAKERFDAVVLEITVQFNCSKDELLSARWYHEYYREMAPAYASHRGMGTPKQVAETA